MPLGQGSWNKDTTVLAVPAPKAAFPLSACQKPWAARRCSDKAQVAYTWSRPLPCGEGLKFKSIGCSYKRPGFGSWHPNCGSQLGVTPRGPGILFWSLWTYVDKYACDKTHTKLKTKPKGKNTGSEKTAQWSLLKRLPVTEVLCQNGLQSAWGRERSLL